MRFESAETSASPKKGFLAPLLISAFVAVALAAMSARIAALERRVHQLSANLTSLIQVTQTISSTDDKQNEQLSETLTLMRVQYDQQNENISGVLGLIRIQNNTILKMAGLSPSPAAQPISIPLAHRKAPPK
jgi:hypothetical protein